MQCHNTYGHIASGEATEHIAICTVGELFGGVERHVLGMISGLRTRRVGVVLVLFHNGELAAQARLLGADPVILPGGNLSLLHTTRRLARILETKQVRLVHVHGYKATVYCAIARRWHAFAMVKTEHGLPEPTFGGRFLACRNSLYHFLDRIATRAARATVCYVTEDLRLQHQLAHDGLRTTVIPNGVERMDRCQFGRPPELHTNRFNLLIVGRLEPVKGHHLAIEAMSSSNISHNVHLHVLGEGPRRQELESYAEARGVADRVHFLGFRRNIYDYLSHCDGLLMPSLHEGLPYTLLESMALGIPVIASRVGGLAEVVSDGVSGVLISRGNSAELAEAISRLHRDPELASRLGDAARRLQRERYSLDAMTGAYLELYRKARNTAN